MRCGTIGDFSRGLLLGLYRVLVVVLDEELKDRKNLVLETAEHLRVDIGDLVQFQLLQLIAHEIMAGIVNLVRLQEIRESKGLRCRAGVWCRRVGGCTVRIFFSACMLILLFMIRFLLVGTLLG